jgi:hypothetical protein
MADMTNKRIKSAMRQVAKYAYWIIGLAALMYVCYYLYNIMVRPVASILVFMGGILALYFYWVKWFVMTEKVQWPPYQSICPDYLTPLAAPGTGGEVKCLDFVGVSRNRRIKVADPRRSVEQAKDTQYAFTIKPGEDKNSLRQRIQAYGLSWVSLLGEN